MSVPGTFTYTPAAGTVLGVGNNQTLSVSFVPSDTTDYANAAATATINVVVKKTPTITWAPAAIVAGTPLGPKQLDATASVPRDVCLLARGRHRPPRRPRSIAVGDVYAARYRRLR